MEILSIPLDAIVVSERQRKDLGDIESLQFSIQQFDLLSPIVVDKRLDGRYNLIAGERRLIAFRRLERTEIPAILKDNLDNLTRKEIEYEENLKRKTLTWLEEARTVASLHKLKKEKYGQALPAKFGRAVWGQKDTAKSLSIAEGKVSEDIHLSEASDQFPELTKILTRKEALRHLRRVSSGLVIEESTMIKQMKECFLYKDFSAAMKDIEDRSVDLIITDLTEYIQESLVKELPRVLKLSGHAFVFFPLAEYTNLVGLFRNLKLKFRERPFIWHNKGDDTYQTFMWFSPALARPADHIHEHLSFRRDKETLHTLAKPYQLLHILVNNSTHRGEFILDPICYGISLVKVCLDLGRNVRCYCPNKILHEQNILDME